MMICSAGWVWEATLCRQLTIVEAVLKMAVMMEIFVIGLL